jgi:hypothetical protein
MSVKPRLQRLEGSQKATADDVSYEVRMEQVGQARQWIDDMTKSIQQGPDATIPKKRHN